MSVCHSVHLSVCLCVCVCVAVSVSVSVSVSASMSACLSDGLLPRTEKITTFENQTRWHWDSTENLDQANHQTLAYCDPFEPRVGLDSIKGGREGF